MYLYTKTPFGQKGKKIKCKGVFMEKKTTVLVPEATRAFCARQQMKVTGLIRAAPNWYEEMMSLRLENAEMVENIARYQKRVADLLEQNNDLLTFKEKVRAHFKAGKGVYNGD
jgi:hypothetical protein